MLTAVLTLYPLWSMTVMAINLTTAKTGHSPITELAVRQYLVA